MARLSALPVELIREICQHMRDGDDRANSNCDWVGAQSALADLCRTSKAFDQIARPLLYTRIQVTARRSKLLSLIRTLISRSDLSHSVRQLKLELDDVYSGSGRLGNTDTANFTEAIRKWWPEGINHPGLYHRLCLQRTLFDMLYIHVPNVETMCIYPAHIGDVALSTILQDVCRLRNLQHEPSLPVSPYTPQAFPLSRLTSLDIGYGWSAAQNAKAVSSLVWTSVTSFSLRHWFAFEGLTLSHLNVRELSLHECGVEYDEPDFLMKFSRRLRKFAYTNTVYGTKTSPKHCIMALKHHSSTLVDLYLVVRNGGPLEMQSNLAYDSFRSFTSLKTLSVHPSDFIRRGWNFARTDPEDVVKTLPKSLEAFKVTEWSITMKRGLLWLREAATRGDLPNLKLLEVQCHSLDRKALAKCADSIKKELQDSTGDSITFPLQISAYVGNLLNPSHRSLFQVWKV